MFVHSLIAYVYGNETDNNNNKITVIAIWLYMENAKFSVESSLPEPDDPARPKGSQDATAWFEF